MMEDEVKQQNHNGKRKAQADTDGDASSCDGQENGNKRARATEVCHTQ